MSTHSLICDKVVCAGVSANEERRLGLDLGTLHPELHATLVAISVAGSRAWARRRLRALNEVLAVAARSVCLVETCCAIVAVGIPRRRPRAVNLAQQPSLDVWRLGVDHGSPSPTSMTWTSPVCATVNLPDARICEEHACQHPGPASGGGGDQRRQQ